LEEVERREGGPTDSETPRRRGGLMARWSLDSMEVEVQEREEEVQER